MCWLHNTHHYIPVYPNIDCTLSNKTLNTNGMQSIITIAGIDWICQFKNLLTFTKPLSIFLCLVACPPGLSKQVRVVVNAVVSIILLKIVPFGRPKRWRKIHRKGKTSHNLNPLTVPEKSVTILTQVDVLKDRTATEGMSVKGVTDLIPDQDVRDALPRQARTGSPILNMHSPLRRQAWAKVLAIHPNKMYVETLTNYLKNGVPVMYAGPEFTSIKNNWKSVELFRDRRDDTILCDVNLGRKSGPYLSPPCDYYRSSPMGAFLKRRSNKLSVIHDLSWPPNWSVNSFIPEELCSVKYASIDDAVSLIKKAGKNCLCTKIDLTDAYKNIMVRKEDWHLLGSSWINDSGAVEYYVDHVLPFGLRSSARLFNMFADGLEFGMQVHGATAVIHYLDDFFSCGAANSNECSNNLDIMIKTCDLLGLPVNPKKTVVPTTCIEFLGIIIDTNSSK